MYLYPTFGILNKYMVYICSSKGGTAMTNYVITIGRQFGSGGREIGKRLAKKLDIPFYDKDLIKITSQRLGYKKEFVQEKDEKRSFFSSSGIYISRLGEYYQMSPEDKVFIELGNVIKELAEQGPCVIVGRCADYILKDVGSINLYIYAPIKNRIERKMAIEADNSITYEEMEKAVLSVDKQRRKYYEYYTDKVWGSSSNYNLCIDSSKLGINGAVDILTYYVDAFGKSDIMPD